MPRIDRSDPAARARLAVLDALTHTPELWQGYVLKGGLALYFAYGSPRRSSDLDFSAVGPFTSEVSEANEQRILHFCHRLDAAFEAVAARHHLAGLRVQRRTLSDEIPAVLAEVGYSAEVREEVRYPATIEMQVVLSEVVCSTAEAEVEGVQIHVPSLGDVLAEKLKALLQQVPRGTARSTDVFDLWYFAEVAEQAIDRTNVAEFLNRKSRPWPAILPVTERAFAAAGVRDHAARNWTALADQFDDSVALPPFDEAFDRVLRFVETLNLPS